jgi:hypothetical protein
MAISLLTLALLGTLALAGTLVLGYFIPAQRVSVGTHFLAALTTTTLLVMAHSFILFFLIATGVELKEMEKASGWGDSFRRRTIAMKSRVFPMATGALLLVMANFILGAAAHTRAIPAWAHGALAWVTLAVCVVTLFREYRVLGDNNRLIEEAGLRRRGGSDPRGREAEPKTEP